MVDPQDVVAGRVRIPRAEFTFTFARSGASGGQNVNKVNSKAVLRWDVTHSPSLPEDVKARFLQTWQSRLTKEGELVLASDEHRDQPRNVEACLARVGSMIQAVLVAPKKRKATRPTHGSVKRRLQDKQQHAQRKRSRGRVQGDD